MEQVDVELIAVFFNERRPKIFCTACVKCSNDRSFQDMTLKDVAHIFHCALRGTFVKAPLLAMMATLFICGVITVFCRSFMFFAEGWWGRAFAYFPFFFVLGIVLAAEFVLLRLYTDRKKTLWSTTLASLDGMFKISLCSLPLVILFLLLWICSGLLILLVKIPYLGSFLSVALFFVPFVLHQAIFVLMAVGLYLAFVLCPMLSLADEDVMRSVYHRLKTFLFFDLILLSVACFPFWIISKGLVLAHTLAVEDTAISWLGQLTASFCIMVPCIAFLTPAALFFIHVAAESQRAFAQENATTLWGSKSCR